MVLRDYNISVCDLIPETLWQKPKVYIFSYKKEPKKQFWVVLYIRRIEKANGNEPKEDKPAVLMRPQECYALFQSN